MAAVAAVVEVVAAATGGCGARLCRNAFRLHLLKWYSIGAQESRTAVGYFSIELIRTHCNTCMLSYIGSVLCIG